MVGYSSGNPSLSKLGGDTSAGVFCRELGLELHFGLKNDCRVFQAKIFTILKAIEAIDSGPTSNSEFCMIFVDRQVALRAIASV